MEISGLEKVKGKVDERKEERRCCVIGQKTSRAQWEEYLWETFASSRKLNDFRGRRLNARPL